MILVYHTSVVEMILYLFKVWKIIFRKQFVSQYAKNMKKSVEFGEHGKGHNDPKIFSGSTKGCKYQGLEC